MDARYAVATIVGVLGMGGGAYLDGRADRSVSLVAFAPSLSREAVMARVIRSGGLPLAEGPWPGLIYAFGAPGFIGAVHREGAWLVLRSTAAGCSER